MTFVFTVLHLFTFAVLLLAGYAVGQEEQTCSWNDLSCYQDPHLKEIEVDLGKGVNETFLAYFPPDVSTFYRQEPFSRKPITPRFNGQFGKFINLSPKPITIFWSSGDRRSDVYISETAPFQASATATFPGHVFLVKLKDKTDKVVHQWKVTRDKVFYVYDPIQLGTLKLTDLTSQELEDYNLQKDNLKFAEQYKAATGIEYLSLYPFRPRPANPMWPADYFGQKHSVLSRETHFEVLPPQNFLNSVSPAVQNQAVLKEYRTVDSDVLNMTLTVLSCAPRVFEIKNFMSKVEIDHVMKLATGMTLHQSSTRAGDSGDRRLDDETRNSRNTWVPRGQSPIIDAIYRRAADLMQLDEAYMRFRQKNEMPHLSTKSSNAELLQLVHYDVGQQYTPHHDFSVPAAIPGQPMRFATILFYLNEGMEGGETTFPRWLNSEDPEPLKVIPEVGKAVLFYSLLPDGNMDDLSQHAAAPVTSGEKWLINLWTWDPMMKF